MLRVCVEAITKVILVLAGWSEIFMTLFLVQSEKNQEINGIIQTGSNPVIKAQHSSTLVFCTGGWNLEQLVPHQKRVLGVEDSSHTAEGSMRVCYQCPLTHTSPHTRHISA